MSNIKPFLHPVRPKEVTDSEPQSALNLFVNSGFTQAATLNTAPNTKLPGLSEEDRQAMHESLKSDSQRSIEYFGPKLQEHQTALIQHIEVIEKIAQSAILQADQAIKQTLASEESLALFKEQVESLSSIAKDAKSQAVTTCKELDAMKQQLDFAKSEAESAKNDTLWTRGISIVAVIVSIVAIIAPLLYG